MRCQEQIFRGGARRNHLLDFRHLGILAHRAADHDESRGAQHFLALGGELLVTHRGRAATLGERRRGGESLAGLTLEYHQLPGFHAPVIGRPCSGRQDAREIRRRRTGRGQASGRSARLNSSQ